MRYAEEQSALAKSLAGDASIPAAPQLARQLTWLIAIRLLVVCTIVFTYHLVASGPVVDASWLRRPANALLAGGSILTLISIALLRLSPRFLVTQAYVQFIGDLVLVYLFINFLGDAVGGFTVLYLVVISVASVLLRSAGLAIAGLAFVAYSLPLLAAHYPSLPAIIRPAEKFDSVVLLLYNLGVHLVGFYAVALLTSFLARGVTRAERALAERDADLAELQVLYRDVVQSISSGLLTTDLSGVVTSVNQAALEILGQGRWQLVGEHVAKSGLLTREIWAEVSEHELARPGSTQRLRFEHDVERGGEMVPVGFSLAVLRGGDAQARGFIVIFQDLTELRRLQEQVRLKDRMAAVGAMASGLAHEVGNPLAAISGSTQMLAGSLTGTPAQRKLLDIIRRESQRLDRTVKSFLDFARPRPGRFKHFDVAALLAEHVELLENSPEVRPEHRLELDLEPRSLEIEADPDQVSQVFWNLVRNALKAMPEGGILTVAGRLAEDRYAIHFRDTGRGMSGEERANLFHPFKSFFDDGTGIGMAIVYRIVDEHGGEIAVDSVPGHGSQITVLLPLRRGDMVQKVEEEAS